MLNTQGLLFLSMTGILRYELNIDIHLLQSLHSAASCSQPLLCRESSAWLLHAAVS